MPRIFFVVSCAILFSFVHCEEWINWSTNRTSVPKDSVLVSNDIEGSYYVIRVTKNGETSPGKFSPELQQAFISTDDPNVKNVVTEFEVKIKFFL